MSFYEEKIFPIFLNYATKPFIKQRQSLLADAKGTVLEIGSGDGANLEFYPELATSIHCLEPNAAMVQTAQEKADTLPIKDRSFFYQGSAHELPFEDDQFDTVVACLVFCTIPDAQLAAKEANRVLKPGGELLYFEHIASPKPKLARWQTRLNPLWNRLACGCNLDRDTKATFDAAGFIHHEHQSWQHPKVPALAATVMRGKATKA